MNLRLPNEFALAVECCAPDPSERGVEATRLAEAVDWPHFLATCRRHRIQGLAWRGVGRLGLLPPAAIAGQLESDAIRIATDAMRSAGICANLLGECERAGIDLLFAKGLTLSRLAYGDAFVKMSHDIDILVRQADVARAGAVLIGMGYVQAVPRHRRLVAWHRVHKESVWTRQGAPTIELHSRLADNRRLIPGIGLDSPTQLVEVASGIALPTLAEDELLAYLAVHGASSAWFRLKWIADFAALLPADNPAEIDRLMRVARDLGAGRAMDVALLLANQLLGITLGAEAKRLSATPACRLLANASLRQLLAEREPTERFLGTASIHWSQFLLMPGARFAVGEVLRQTRSVLTRG